MFSFQRSSTYFFSQESGCKNQEEEEASPARRKEVVVNESGEKAVEKAVDTNPDPHTHSHNHCHVSESLCLPRSNNPRISPTNSLPEILGLPACGPSHLISLVYKALQISAKTPLGSGTQSDLHSLSLHQHHHHH